MILMEDPHLNYPIEIGAGQPLQTAAGGGERKNIFLAAAS